MTPGWARAALALGLLAALPLGVCGVGCGLGLDLDPPDPRRSADAASIDAAGGRRDGGTAPDGDLLEGGLSLDGAMPDAMAIDAAIVDAAGEGGVADAAPWDGGPSDASIDAARPDAGPGIDCAAPGLVLCMPFDGDTNDHSGLANHARATDVAFVAGMAGLALQRGDASDVVIDASASLDLTSATIEFWVRPLAAPYPADGRAGLIDRQDRYGVFLYGDLRVLCSFAGDSLRSPSPIRVGEWTHIACTMDATAAPGDLAHVLYVNGLPVARGVRANVPAASFEPLRIGENSPLGGDELSGEFDNLRLFRVVRTAAEICAAAGCPSPMPIPVP